MRTTFRIILITVLVAGVVGSIGAGAASWYLTRKIGPDFWVALIEDNTNCRAEVKAVHLSLFTRPATLKLEQVRLAQRDDEVAKPYAERTPLGDQQVPILIPEAALEVKLEDLLNRRLFIQRLLLDAPVVQETQDEQGLSSLEQLFVGTEAAFVPPPPGAVQPTTSGTQRYEEVPRAIPLNRANLPPQTANVEPAEPPPSSEDPARFEIKLASVVVENGQFTIVNRTTNVAMNDVDVALTNIDFDSSRTSGLPLMHVVLATDINVTGMARIGGVKRPAELANLSISGQGDLLPPAPGAPAAHPLTQLQLTLAKGSVLGGHVTMGDTAGKELRKLQEYGVDLTPVRVGGPLQQDVVLDGVFSNNRFTLRSQTRFVFPEYDVVMEPNSWINGSQDQHHLRLHLSCGPALQQRLESGIAQAKLGESIARAVTKALADEQGRMTFDIVSSGSLSNPEVKPSVDRVLKNLLSGQGLGDLLQGLLKKL